MVGEHVVLWQKCVLILMLLDINDVWLFVVGGSPEQISKSRRQRQKGHPHQMAFLNLQQFSLCMEVTLPSALTALSSA